MLAIAVRTAERMRIDSESELSKSSPLEAEMCRRLWWALIMFDARVGELAYFPKAQLNPVWDCKVPLNVNDSDLRPEMEEPPNVQGLSTEALFVVVRAEIADFMRNTAMQLDFSTPRLKVIAKHVSKDSAPDGQDLLELERLIESRYLKLCDPSNALHYMTLWMSREHIAKYRFIEHNARLASLGTRQTEAQRDLATSLALRVLICDTKVMTSPLTKGFRWLNEWYFPFPAYFQILQDLKGRPFSNQSQRAWEVMYENYVAWPWPLDGSNPIFQTFSKIVLNSWETTEANLKRSSAGGDTPTPTPPAMVTSVKNLITQKSGQSSVSRESVGVSTQKDAIMATNIDDLAMSIPSGFADQGLFDGPGMLDGSGVVGAESYASMNYAAQDDSNAEVSLLDWATFGF